MDVTTFVTGYFIGLALGAAVVLAWTARYGRVSLKSVGVWWRDLAQWTRKADSAAFASRRGQTGHKTPAE